ncbi:DNA replication and repair protein RecF [Hoeflea sp. IMCC20628]|uniref:DNA replication/repair protein RecF n=1 Tax=Hoeflea sp. IMCC20628 TaxID=1620421 RepID=UPI00063AE9E4|nr:DNA replication/repair protein RecF [Hoeflea sp. IMCC20628]AKI02565.1 DNA replication and repair protein RecF [Hoeflea sp. IMCC20628]
MVHIQRLKLAGFRNYASLSLELDQRHVVLAGDNGAGKTNLMEALSLLTPGRGMRRSSYGDMIKAGSSPQAGFSVFASLEGMAGPVDIGTGVEGGEDGGGRRVRINGAPARSTDELLEHLRLLWLTPAMDGLFTGPAGDRRRFLDRLVLSVDPAHGGRALNYERAMRSRNRLLSEGRPDPAWLDGLEGQMVELGVAMAMARNEVVSLLSGLIESQTAQSAFPAATLRLEGFLEDAAHPSASDMEADFAGMLKTGRGRDSAAGRTLSGPHRSDLIVHHRAKAMPAALSSTGEQKALLIGIVLGHAQLVRGMTGHAPVLLLDEIAAHLDEGRRAALFDLIEALECQAFMTGTDAQMFASLGARGQILTVTDGKVTPHQDATGA